MRFWIISLTVFVLVALPVLPLQFNGLAIPTWTGPQLTEIFNLFIAAAPKKTQTAHKAPPPEPARVQNDPLEQVRLMEHAAQDLLVQVSRQPTEPSLHNRLGLIYIGLGELEKAQDHFERSVDLARMNVISATDRLKALQSQGKLNEAANQLVESSRLNVELSAAHSNLARLYEKKGQHSKVLAELDMLNREGVINDSSVKTNAGIASAGIHRVTPIVARLLARAESLMQSQRFYEAMQDFKNVIAMDPDVAVAHRDLGVLNAMASNHQAAVDELETAVRLEPNDAVSHNNLGLAYQTIGKLTQAKEHFEQAIASNPRLVDSAINLGNLYASKESYDFSKQVLQQAVLSNPRSAIAHNNLGTVLSLQGDSQEAINEFRKAVALQPDLVSAHYGLGLAFFKAKSYRQAIEEFKLALMLNPKLTGVHEKIEQATRKASTSGFNS